MGDEPTSRVDPNTDSLVQQTVRHQLQGMTVITIAHRLHTVVDYDKVLVMRDGHALECAQPFDLLNHPGSEFCKLVSSLGEDAVKELRSMAAVAAARGVHNSACTPLV